MTRATPLIDLQQRNRAKKQAIMASKLDRLAAMAREGAKSTVAEATGNNGQPKVILEHGSGALAEIYAHGATVTRYRSLSGRPRGPVDVEHRGL